MNDSPRILIVDDEPSARQTMEMLLLREGYDFFFAANGLEALSQVEKTQPDVILLDVMMPRLNGFEVCQRLKNDRQWQHIPIILVTALDSKEDLARGLNAGADDFLHKPYNPLELRARVRSMLRIKRRHDAQQAALQLRDDLSNMIVHDIRGPLASMMVYSDLLENETISNRGKAHLTVIRHEIDRLSSFLTDMLLMAKMENGRLRHSPTSEDMNAIVTAAVAGFQSMAQLKKLQITVNLPSQTAYIAVDANLWRRVIDNLLSNAVKFSPTGGGITVELTYPEPIECEDCEQLKLRLRIMDEGPGIPIEHQDTIFDKFKVIAAGRRDISQVGLGLAFCKMIVDAHNGRIFVQPNQPQGAVFTVEI
jgi:signal transduction histidine kinase